MTAQLGLFDGPTTDDVVRITARSEDEKQFEKERRRKRIKAPDRALPDGPCCARCANWSPPTEYDRGCGECRAIAVIAPSSKFDCRVAGVEEAAQQERGWEYLRSKPWYPGCTAYAEKATCSTP